MPENQALMPQPITRDAISTMSAEEIVLIQGDLSVLTPAQRVEYYLGVCKSLDLNPLTKPFDYIILNGKMVLYAKKDATDQIRDKRHISVERLERAMIPQSDILTVTAYGKTADGRSDASIGAVSIRGLVGEGLANAMMKAETKAKRRLTLSLAGLGILDETEVGSVAGAMTVSVNEDGEVEDKAPATLEEAIARADAAAPPAESPPAAPAVSPGPETAPAAPMAESAPETAPDVVDGDFTEDPTQPETVGLATPPPVTSIGADPGIQTAAQVDAEVVRSDTGRTGLTFAEFKTTMREKHIFTKEAADAANRLFPGGTSLDKDLTDDQRLAVIMDVIANRP